MSAAFTPGPWIYENNNGGKRGILAAPNIYGVGEVYDRNGSAENEANARLIAAAPELYEALVEARAALWAIEDSAVESGFDKLGDIIADRLTKANAALAKARGEA